MTAWINPNDKTQAKYLPHIGEPVLLPTPARSITDTTRVAASALGTVLRQSCS